LSTLGLFLEGIVLLEDIFESLLGGIEGLKPCPSARVDIKILHPPFFQALELTVD
jgi:hypothetical protein